MKFAKELQEDLVPEWRAKYLNYKLGKKKVKAVSRALAKANKTPRTPRSSIFRRDPPAAHPSFLSPQMHERPSTSERDLLRPHSEGSHEHVSYGSVTDSHTRPGLTPAPPSFHLPGPALSPSIHGNSNGSAEREIQRRPQSASSNRIELIQERNRDGTGDIGSPASRPNKRRTMSLPHNDAGREQSLIKRLFTDKFNDRRVRGKGAELQQSPYKDFEDRNREFNEFLESQLDMIESFYRLKEDEAAERLEVLKYQLHKMRDLRVREVQKFRQRKVSKIDETDENLGLMHESEQEVEGGMPHSKRNQIQDSTTATRPWYAPFEHKLGIGHYRFGKNTEAFERMIRDQEAHESEDSVDRKDAERLSPANGSRMLNKNQLDYERRIKKDQKVPYDRAKRLLKAAMQEFYRGLELLKSYTLLNRTAFRKINKKYDKAVQARPTLQFFNERINRAYFVQSNVVEQCIVQVEDLFARYFCGGNRKVAISKLRGRIQKPEDLTDSIFRSGLFLGAGTGLGLPGLAYAAGIITQDNATNIPLQTPTSYLLQLYGGYFLMLLLFMFFCIDARVWSRHRINYVFIFEFDTRHNLDWRQLLEIPTFFFFLLGLILLLNFHPYSRSYNETMFIYWPVILVGITLGIIFLPFPVLYHKSRLWLAQSSFRLLLAGLFSVEFRDFFLGDMFCSLTYSLGNIEVFFCLYVHDWMSPAQCNSSSSRLLGFFSALPGIWRFLQCLRRYAETKNAFPHLLNCGKYLATILFYMTLSLYRIAHSESYFITFVIFATLNSVYTSLWDIFMDWSLGHPAAPHRFLRAELGYKKTWWYYGAMIIDPLLRFNWVFYAIFRFQVQHSAVLSFMVSLSEVCRRAIWTIFRVENEHCTNVGRFRASRDVSLPYAVEVEADTPSGPPSDGRAVDVEAARARFAPPSSPLQRMSTAISLAHAQDFVRKRVPGSDAKSGTASIKRAEDEAESDDDEEEEEEEEEEDIHTD